MTKARRARDGMALPGERRVAIRTTLYDLIDVLNGEVRPGEETAVVRTILHLIKKGQLKGVKVI
jgi:hypothetical protein